MEYTMARKWTKASRAKLSRSQKATLTATGRTDHDCETGYTVEPAGATPTTCEHFGKTIFAVP
jgi:hypothetical protein